MTLRQSQRENLLALQFLGKRRAYPLRTGWHKRTHWLGLWGHGWVLQELEQSLHFSNWVRNKRAKIYSEETTEMMSVNPILPTAVARTARRAGKGPDPKDVLGWAIDTLSTSDPPGEAWTPPALWSASGTCSYGFYISHQQPSNKNLWNVQNPVLLNSKLSKDFSDQVPSEPIRAWGPGCPLSCATVSPHPGIPKISSSPTIISQSCFLI